MDNTKQDLQRLIESGGDLSGEDEALVSYVEIRGTEDDVREIREKIAALLDDLQRRSAEEDEVPEDPRRFRFTLASSPWTVSDQYTVRRDSGRAAARPCQTR